MNNPGYRIPPLFCIILLVVGGPVRVQSQDTTPFPGQQQSSGTAQFSTISLNESEGVRFRASSTLEDDSPHTLGTYGMQTLFDGDRQTGWSEGTDGPGIGEVLWIDLSEHEDTLLIRNGFARSERLFRMNNRVRELEVSLWKGVLPDGMVSEWTAMYVVTPLTDSETVQLEDTMELQEIPLPFPSRVPDPSLPDGYDRYVETHGFPPAVHEVRTFLRMEIGAVYPGSRWDDTCLTEVVPFSRNRFSATDVYGDDGVIRYDTADRRSRSLYRNRDHHYEPFLTDSTGIWTVAFETAKHVDGRTETVYRIFRLPYPEPCSDESITGPLEVGLIPDYFVRQKEMLFLVFHNGERVLLLTPLEK